jgi:hypothetical protein
MNPETLDARFLQALLSLRFEFDEKAFLRSRRLLLSYRSLGPDVLRCRGATHLKSVLYSLFGTLLGAFISINFAFFRFSDRAIIKDATAAALSATEFQISHIWRANSMSPIFSSSSISHASVGSLFLTLPTLQRRSLR